MPTSLRLEVFEQIAFFRESVVPDLEEDETKNSAFLGNLFRLTESPVFMVRTLDDAGQDLAAMIPADSLMVTKGSEASHDLVIKELLRREIDIPGVMGPTPYNGEFADRWIIERGCRMGSVFHMRLYELTQVAQQPNSNGSRRAATEEDLSTIGPWLHGFRLEALSHDPPSLDDSMESAQRLLREGRFHLWEVDNRPVAMAGQARPTRRTITINAVYTPPENRSKGYASRLVASLSQYGLDLGKSSVVLFTDLRNPVSNSIYMKIGFRPVCDYDAYHFNYERSPSDFSQVDS